MSEGSCKPHRTGSVRVARLVLAVLLVACCLRAQVAFGRPIHYADAGNANDKPAVDLTSVRQIRSLTPSQAKEARPVRLRGVVTVLSGWKSSFFFQDASSGISVDPSGDVATVKTGDEVEIQGVTGAGKFAPIVVAAKVTVLGRAKLPPAHLFNAEQLAGGKEDSQWLAVRGIVRSAEIKPGWGRPVLFLTVDIGGGNLVTARVHDFANPHLEQLLAATITVQGVCGTVFNDKRQFVGLRMFVASLDDVKIEKAAPDEPFALPIAPLDGLLNFDEKQGAINQVRIHGIVTYSKAGQGLYMQDGTQGVFVKSGQTTAVPLGSQVDVVGYPASGRYSTELENSVFRVTGPPRQITPIVSSAAAMIVTSDGFSSAPYDSMLVQVQGKLIEEVPGVDEDLLLFQDGPSLFTARLSRSERNKRAWALGSLLSVTGICVANADEAHEARSFEILLRSNNDLVLLEHAPWWTATHALWVVMVLFIAVLGMLGWLAVLRRQAELRALAVADPLTGLYNRRGFLLLADQQWRLALRGNHPFLLFYFDVNRFKEINDSFGHKEGDVALITVAEILKQCFRKADIIGRLGGDEFAVTAIEATEPSRLTLERRISAAIEQSNEKSGRPFQLSLSVGILACDSSLGPIPIEDLLARADELMYRQKRERTAEASQTLSSAPESTT